MKTDATKDSNRTPQGFFNGLRAWKPLILAVFLPLAVACTDTVTGLEEDSVEREHRIHQPSDGDDSPERL